MVTITLWLAALLLAVLLALTKQRLYGLLCNAALAAAILTALTALTESPL